MTEEEQTEQEQEQMPQREPVDVTISDIELEALKNEAEEYKEKYFRTLAESENLRKRLMKEKQELVQFAIQNVIIDFLMPLDHFENALFHAENMSEEVKHWAKGFEMILGQFKDVLANNNIKPMTSEGRKFDPHYHDAVEAVETNDHPPGTILEELVKGYTIGDKTLRPARVKVARTPEAPKNQEENKEDKQGE